MQASLLNAVKTIPSRAIRRGLYYLTKQVVAAISKYRLQVAPQLCADLLKVEPACE